MTRIPWALLAAALAVAYAAGAAAQSPDEWRAAVAGGTEGLALEQSYTGTRPGQGNRLPRVEELRGKPGGWVTWPGFLMREDGGSRLFLQTTAPLQYTRTAGKLRFTLRFEHALVYLNNNRNPLVTAFFNTPVKRAWLKRRGKNVDLVVELKTACQEAVTQFKDDDGYHYLFIDFPPGDYPRSQGTAPRPEVFDTGSWGYSGSWSPPGGGGTSPQPSAPGDPAPGGAATAAGPADTVPAEDIDLDYGTNAPPDPEPPPEE